jgi:hypothetical protein
LNVTQLLLLEQLVADLSPSALICGFNRVLKDYRTKLAPCHREIKAQSGVRAEGRISPFVAQTSSLLYRRLPVGKRQ